MREGKSEILRTHIECCENLDCDYYSRIKKSIKNVKTNAAISIGAGSSISAFGIGSIWLAPFTGGLSVLCTGLISAFTITASLTVIIGSGNLAKNSMIETFQGIENELKLKWENEQEFNNWQDELNKTSKELTDLKNKSKDVEADNNWLNDIIKEKEVKIQQLKGKLLVLWKFGLPPTSKLYSQRK